MIVIEAEAYSLILYAVLSAICTFAATYTALTWWSVGGIRGFATTVLFASLAMIFGASSWLHSYNSPIPTEIAVMVVRICAVPATLSALLLSDLYGSDHNNHRSWTSRSYRWYERVTERRPRREKREVQNEA